MFTIPQMLRFSISFLSILSAKNVALNSQSSIAGAVMTVNDASDFSATLAQQFLNGGCTTLKIDSLSALPTGTSKTVFDYVQILDLTGSQITNIPEIYFLSNNVIQEVKLKTGTSISALAFKLSSIKTINFASVTTIAQSAFESCYNIGDVTVSYQLGESAFASSGIKTLTLSGSANIPKSLCANCRSLTSVTFTSSLSVGDSAFQNCYKLASFPPEKATSVGENAFENCYALTSFKTASPLNEFRISNSAFENSGLKELVMPGSASQGSYSIGNRAFYGCKLETLTSYPNWDISSSTNGFSKNLELTTVDIQIQDIYSISAELFSRCSKLSSINLQKAGTINSYAFYYCTSLTTIDISSCTRVAMSAFQGCSQLETITFKSDVSLGKYSFSNIKGPEEMVLSNDMSYDNYVFSGATGIKRVTLKGFPRVGMFANCPNLEFVDLSQTTSIPNYCFFNCPKLTLSNTEITC